MKRMKIILALALVLVVLSGCTDNSAVLEELAGQWTMTVPAEQEDATYLLDMMDVYTEERVFVDLDSMNYVLIATFGSDGSYSFVYEVEPNKVCVREFYEGVMDALYEHRAELTDVYGEEPLEMTREEFNQFYAEMYDTISYEDWMNILVDDAFDYDALSEPLEEGTFKIVGSNLMCTVEGETSSIGFQLDGDTLTLTYIDGTEVYTRVK